jgi:hypothetical protein
VGTHALLAHLSHQIRVALFGSAVKVRFHGIKLVFEDSL